MSAKTIACILLLAVACGGGGSNNSDGDMAPVQLLPDLGNRLTYASFAQPFFTSYCVSCHPSSVSSRDFTKYSVISANSHDIACGVSPTALTGCSGNPAPAQFPIGNGPKPTDDERNEMVQWIFDGLPQ